MSEELQSLLDKINNDGIRKAEAERSRIISDAEKEAEKIIAEARNRAAGIIAEAQSEADNFTRRADAAAKQSARDIALQLRKELNSRLEAAVGNATAQALSAEFMAQLIRELAEKFAVSPDAELTVRAAVRDLSALDTALKSALADSFKKNPKLFAAAEISGGMQVDFKDGSCFFDFSDAAVMELMAEYVGGKLAEIFKA